jgi:hypothetical protein
MTDSGFDEKRHFTRIPFEAAAHLASGKQKWISKMLDISLKGVLVERPRDWAIPVGQTVQVALELQDSDVTISMDAVVAHIEHNHIGFACKHIDLDSISHLRRLIELNLGDPELLNRELAALKQY